MAQAQSVDGARPGNDIGSGMSLPRSDRAGNIDAATAKSEIAPNLPAPAGVERIAGLLLRARDTLAQNQTGAAQEALERAETRALTRSVPYGEERDPANDSLTRGIRDALALLAAGRLDAAQRRIDALGPAASDADLANP